MKVLRSLKSSYPSIEDAEKAFNIDYFGTVDPPPREEHMTPKAVRRSITDLSPVFTCSPSSVRERPDVSAEIIENIVISFPKLTKCQRKQLMQQLFVQYIHEDINPELPASYISTDVLKHVAGGIDVLYKNSKENLFLCLGKCLRLKNDGTTALPLDRMPFGLISHNLKFFSVDNAGVIKVPDDYKSWMETMYAKFGQSWAALHLGPMWSYDSAEEVFSKDREKEPVDKEVDVITLALKESGLTSINSANNEMPVSDAENISVNSTYSSVSMSNVCCSADIVQSGFDRIPSKVCIKYK